MKLQLQLFYCTACALLPPAERWCQWASQPPSTPAAPAGGTSSSATSTFAPQHPAGTGELASDTAHPTCKNDYKTPNVPFEVPFFACFSCSCTDGWFGTNCQETSSACTVGKSQCAEDSKCAVHANGTSFCLCPLGKKGEFCEEGKYSCYSCFKKSNC